MWIGTWPVSDYTFRVSMRVILYVNSILSFSGHITKHSNPFGKPVYTYGHTFGHLLSYYCIHVVLFVLFFSLFLRFIYRLALYTHKLVACFVQLSWFQVIVLRDKTCIQFWSLNTKPLLIYIRAVCVSFVPPDDDGKQYLNS